jgi:hypothetical protein
MAREIIVWDVFLEALKKQPASRREDWLSRWRFADAGVFPEIEPLGAIMQPRYTLHDAVADYIFNQPMDSGTLH